MRGLDSHSMPHVINQNIKTSNNNKFNKDLKEGSPKETNIDNSICLCLAEGGKDDSI